MKKFWLPQSTYDKTKSYAKPQPHNDTDSRSASDSNDSHLNEPFAVFATRGLHFIDIRTSKAYDAYIGGKTNSRYDATFSSLSSDCFTEIFSDDESIYSTTTGPDSWEQNQDSSSTYAPDLNFTVIWDPELGFAAYKDGHRFLTTPRADEEVYNLYDSDAGRHLDPSYTNSEVDRQELKPLISSLSLDKELPAIPPYSQQAVYSTCASQNPHVSDPTTYGYNKPTDEKIPNILITTDEAIAESVEDEGFFEAVGIWDHPDCDPHLPSRFSTTTTSTSNYIEVDFGTQGVSPNTPTYSPRRAFSNIQRHPTSTQSLPLKKGGSKYLLPRNSLAPRISRAYKGIWTKHPEDERWIYVEIKHIITHRIVED